jgi:hypothetical protein
VTGRGEIVLKVTFVCAILSYSFWSRIKQTFDLSIFYPSVALCFLGYTFVIYEFVRIAYKTNKKLSSLLAWSEVILATTISNVLDEMFFDPTKLELNEYIGFVLIILIAVFNDYKRKK